MIFKKTLLVPITLKVNPRALYLLPCPRPLRPSCTGQPWFPQWVDLSCLMVLGDAPLTASPPPADGPLATSCLSCRHEMMHA